MTIGDKIRLHRKALGLTQTELGEKLGVKTNAVSKWECGRVDDIPTSKIKAMAKLFDVQPSYLIDEKQPAPTNEDELNAEDKKLLMMIHNLTPENRERIVAIIEALAGLE
ncbi:helix-turn-helix domain-containing protein [Dysosmobacter sp.]|jgi:transcriptional regulator with XRE-family HTH domain|uniref:helix-turn-helix domain-containing protein n=1 Tax=Dysosmobacter sp. TaxID=2591382 RepID=UPI002F94E6AF